MPRSGVCLHEGFGPQTDENGVQLNDQSKSHEAYIYNIMLG